MKWIYNFLLENTWPKNERIVSKRNYSKNIEYRGAVAKEIQWRIIPQYSSKWSEEFQKELSS